MKVWTSYHIFEHPWDTVVQAAYRKYPNPLNPSVLGTDVIERHVDKGILYSHRLVTTEWRLPRWVASFFGNGPCYGSEWSEVNPQTKEMVVKTVNLSLGTHISVGEEVRYTSDPEDPNKTLLTQQAVVSIKGIPLIDQMERLLTKTIEQNAKKGRMAIEWVIERIQADMKDITTLTKRGMDDLQSAAKKSLDDIQSIPNLTPPPQSIPKL
ncbi:PRELI domain containing slowmo [Nomia melanderi]|uniref:PRELI domain containing slowmo n=1 Tax=Nomia melanderi TaxID=2448451 RepID=UPI0013046A36|nr:PRELI domain containing protein 3A [Nomia melanderi]